MTFYPIFFVLCLIGYVELMSQDVDPLFGSSRSKRVIEVIYNDDPESVIQLFYDSLGRICKETKGGETYIYQYTTDQVVKSILKSDYWLVSYQFIINTSGHIDSCKIIGQEGTEISKMVFTYNKLGQLTELVLINRVNLEERLNFSYLASGHLGEVLINQARQKMILLYEDNIVSLNWNPQMIFADLFPPISAKSYTYLPSKVIVQHIDTHEILSQLEYTIQETNGHLVYIEYDTLNGFKNTIQFTLK